MTETDLPPAPSDYEDQARRMNAEGLSPEEYAARWAHSIMCFSMDNYQYRDRKLHAWIHALAAILFQRSGTPTLEELRERFLTPDEREEIRRHSLEDF